MENILKDVTSIDLIPATYGENMDERFKTIDENFDKLMTSEYLTGARGNSVNVYECVISKDSNESCTEKHIYTKTGDGAFVTKGKLYDMVREAITPMSDEGLVDINQMAWDSNLNNSKILLICEEIRSKEYIISALPYSHTDLRFENIYNDYSKYKGAFDTSTYIVWDANNDSFVKFNNKQTLYYNESLDTFCWKINGEETEVAATGPRGKDGHNGIVYIVRSNSDSTQAENRILVDQIFVFKDGKHEFVDIANSGILLEQGDSAICLYTEAGEGESNTNLIISPLEQDSANNWYIYKDLNSSIITVANTEGFRNALMGIATSAHLQGLFVPASNLNQDGVQMGHMMWVDDENLNNTNQKVLNVGLVDNVTDAAPAPSTEGIKSVMNVNYDVFVKGDVTANQVTVGDPTGTYLTITPESFKMSGVEFDSQSGTVPGDLTVGGNAIIAGNTNIAGNVTAGGAEIGSMTTLNNVTINGSITNKEYTQMKNEIEWLNSVYDITASKSNTPTLSKVARHIHVYSPGGERYHVRLMQKHVLENMRKQIYGDNPLGILVFYIISNGEIELDDSSDVTWVRNAWDKDSHEVKGIMTCVWNGSTLQTYL